MLNNTPSGLSLPVGALDRDRLYFDNDKDLCKALGHGLFYLQYPPGLDFSPGIRFASHYYLSDEDGKDPYSGYQQRELSGTRLGYSDPSDDQVELFQLEANLWARHLPSEVSDMLWEMNRIAKVALHAMFDACEVPEGDRDKVAEGLSRDEALQYCLFNHYRSRRNKSPGFTAHKDSGFITLLHTTEEGLETLEEGTWYDVPPLPGCFTVVLGHSFEVLTAKREPRVNASYHRVRDGQNFESGRPDRQSFGVYIGPRFEQDLFEYSESGVLKQHMSFMEFQRQKAAQMGYEFHPLVDAS